MLNLNQLKQVTSKTILTRLMMIVMVSALMLSVSPALAQEGTSPEAEPEAVPIPETLTFSHDSMVTGQPFPLTINSLVGGTIRYTTNGSEPGSDNQPYTGPIAINESTVIKAKVFDANNQPVGISSTKSYIIAFYNQTIPVISISAEWADLDTLHGFAEEKGREWERPMNIEYFAPGGQVQFNVKAGLRIHGGKSRKYSEKKSYRVYFRKEYGGPGKLDYPLFEDSPVTKFDKLVLRAGFNDTFHYRGLDGLAAPQTYIAKYVGDQVTRNLHRDMGQPIAHGKWVLLYLNGQYYGLYNLTERIDDEFMQSYSEDPKNSEWHVIGKEVGYNKEGIWIDEEIVMEGNYGAWLDHQNWIGSTNFTEPPNIGGLEWRVDVENLFSYMFLQAYVQNYDWPGNNWIVYRRIDPGAQGNEAQWRLMMWDAEYSFGTGYLGYKTDINTLQNVYSPHDSITRMLEKPFIGSCEFKHRFVNRAREYLGVENKFNKPDTEVGQLSKERVKAEIIKQAEIIRPFMQAEIDRWAPFMTIEQFDQNIQNTLHFVDVREDVILNHLDNLRYQTFTECK